MEENVSLEQNENIIMIYSVYKVKLHQQFLYLHQIKEEIFKRGLIFTDTHKMVSKLFAIICLTTGKKCAMTFMKTNTQK